jgi:coenzyme F420-reducing hydrogenase alpha subunit
MPDTRSIRVEALTRVEGEGGLLLRLRGDEIDAVELNIYEPPRLFEALLRGRALEDVPDVTARICGICPVAYQMSAVHALEAGLGVEVTPEIRQLRRLLYCGEWLESHALHVHFLHAPDFLGYDGGIEMARDYPDEVNRGLRLKKHGNELLEVLGGRAIHPINVAVGGFFRMPRAEAMARLVPDFQWGLQAAVDTTRWLATLSFPDFEVDYDFVSLVHPDEYPMNEGRIASSRGDSIAAAEFETHYAEQQVPHSTALHCIWKATGKPYLLGPLARVNLNRERLSPTARRVADEVGIAWPCRNPFKSIVARGLEIIHAYQVALGILEQYRPPKPPRVKYEHRAGSGCWATEAPRGMLYHRYAFDEAGAITEARIVPPTSQNQGQIEADLRSYVPQAPHDNDQQLAMACERLVRSYDPCISCATHFLKVRIERC